MTLFYGQNSMKSSLKSRAILHFRDSKLTNFPYKASHLQRSTRASKLQFQLPQRKRASYGRGGSECFGYNAADSATCAIIIYTMISQDINQN